MKKHLFLILYSLFLLCATTLSLLGTFVFVDDKNNVEILDNNFDDDITKDNGIFTESSYIDDNIEINITTIREYETQVYIADIKINNHLLLKTAFAMNKYGLNIKEKTSVIAKRNEAILAINGDYYGFREKGYVIRNGVLYDPNREARDNESDILIINNDGSFTIIKEASVSSKTLYLAKAWQVFCFGPGLISNRQIIVSPNTEVAAHKASNPRTALGIISKGHYVMVVSDGRTEESAGLTLYQLATILKSYGVTDAYNLDGGGSSVMVFNGNIVNKPTTNGVNIRERSISDIVYIGY